MPVSVFSYQYDINYIINIFFNCKTFSTNLYLFITLERRNVTQFSDQLNRGLVVLSTYLAVARSPSTNFDFSNSRILADQNLKIIFIHFALVCATAFAFSGLFGISGKSEFYIRPYFYYIYV